MTKHKTTLVLGASDNPARYSNLAIKRLRSHQHNVVAVGRKDTIVEDVTVVKGMPAIKDVDTITLYLNPSNQLPFYDYILSLQPRRIIFNPGTENEELEQLAQQQGIQTTEACTLVLLSTGQY